MDHCSLWAVAGGGGREGRPCGWPTRDMSFFPHLCVILHILEGPRRSQATPDSRRLSVVRKLWLEADSSRRFTIGWSTKKWTTWIAS